ncbi:hypothetical protein TNCV_201191 [Trichonephila clavipes]|nr:hypothetical protein TNCV_201191 [Trichonephila clavipes]
MVGLQWYLARIHDTLTHSELNRTVTCMMLTATANDRCKQLVPCRDEYRDLDLALPIRRFLSKYAEAAVAEWYRYRTVACLVTIRAQYH